MVRKESKGHGTNQYVEGPVQPGQRVVIVEDVVTTGGSSLQAIERVEAFGLKVVRVIAIIDRMEGGRRPLPPAAIPSPVCCDRGFWHPAAAVKPTYRCCERLRATLRAAWSTASSRLAAAIAVPSMGRAAWRTTTSGSTPTRL